MQTIVQTCRQRNRLRIAEDFNALLGLVQDHCAVFTMRQMPLEFLLDRGLEFPVNVIRQLPNDAFAVHWGAPCRKWRFNFSRSFSRARSKRDFTFGTEIPRASAVSCVESSSMSRKTRTIRNSGSSLSMTSANRVCNSAFT